MLEKRQPVQGSAVRRRNAKLERIILCGESHPLNQHGCGAALRQIERKRWPYGHAVLWQNVSAAKNSSPVNLQHQPRGDPTAHAHPGSEFSRQLHKNVSKSSRAKSREVLRVSSQKWSNATNSCREPISWKSLNTSGELMQVRSVASLEDFSLPLPPKVHRSQHQ